MKYLGSEKGKLNKLKSQISKKRKIYSKCFSGAPSHRNGLKHCRTQSSILQLCGLVITTKIYIGPAVCFYTFISYPLFSALKVIETNVMLLTDHPETFFPVP